MHRHHAAQQHSYRHGEHPVPRHVRPPELSSCPRDHREHAATPACFPGSHRIWQALARAILRATATRPPCLHSSGRAPLRLERFKRLIKSPKVYWVDSGLLCFLLGIETEAELIRSPFLGSVFEGFIASEIVKNQVNAGGLRELYYFRDQQGLEVDFITSAAGGGVRLIEARWSKTILPAHALPMERLRRSIRRRPVEAVIVHPAASGAAEMRAVTPGVRALSIEQFLSGDRSRRPR
ncbi:MAG: DUF4143 domain-containing protein [Planctomycetota bacterium]